VGVFVFRVECRGRTEQDYYRVASVPSWGLNGRTQHALRVGLLSIMSTPSARFSRVSLCKSGEGSGGETWQISRLVALFNVWWMQ
jgi:hypothetical protein